MSSPAVAYARQNHPRFLKELKDLLRIPSISTLPENKGDCRRAAEALAAELTRIGMEHARLIETTGHPLVYADWLHAAGKPTGLFYGHYDVQPVDPIDEWISPPFEPAERDGNHPCSRAAWKWKECAAGPSVPSNNGVGSGVRGLQRVKTYLYSFSKEIRQRRV